MNLLKSALKQFELVAEAFSILLHAAYLNRFLLRISFPSLMEVRADIRGEMHYAGWRDLNYGPCYWIDLARHWVPTNLTVCTNSSVPSSDSEDFVPAFCYVTIFFAVITCMHCFILFCVMVKNGHGKLLDHSAFHNQMLAFTEARGQFQGLAMMFLFMFLFFFSLFGPYCLISFGISSIQRFFGESAVLPGGTLLLLCLMLYNIGGLLGVWNIRSRYEQVAALVRLQSAPSRPEATHISLYTENPGVDLFQRIVGSAMRLFLILVALCTMGMSFRLDYPGVSVVFLTGWWSDLVAPAFRTATTSLEMLRINDARLSHWYNISVKYANPSHHPELMDSVSPLASFFGSVGWYFSEFSLWCYFGMLSMCILGLITIFHYLGAIHIREIFWLLQSLQYNMEADNTHLHGLSDGALTKELLVIYTLLSTTRALWTSAVLVKVGLLLVPERWYLPGYLLYMVWLTSKATTAGMSLKKRVQIFKDYVNAQDGIWI